MVVQLAAFPENWVFLVCVYPPSSATQVSVVLWAHHPEQFDTRFDAHRESFFGHFSWRSCSPLRLDAGVTDKRSMLLSWFKLRQWGPSEYAPEYTCGVVHTPCPTKWKKLRSYRRKQGEVESPLMWLDASVWDCWLLFSPVLTSNFKLVWARRYNTWPTR